MKSIHWIAGCAAVMVAMGWTGYAADPQKASPGNPKSEAAAGAPPSAADALPPGGADGSSNVVVRPSPFTTEVSAEFMRKVMETSAKIDAAKRQIADRQAVLYDTNPEIKSLRARMIDMQKEINRILDADSELAELKMNRDLMWSTMPVMPKTREPAPMMRLPPVR